MYIILKIIYIRLLTNGSIHSVLNIYNCLLQI